jgi:hypothetical protein
MGHRGEIVIPQLELLAGLPYDPADLRVMDMTDAGKKVVFYLVV